MLFFCDFYIEVKTEKSYDVGKGRRKNRMFDQKLQQKIIGLRIICIPDTPEDNFTEPAFSETGDTLLLWTGERVDA